MNKKYISSDSKWESEVGYSRAIRTGDRIFVSGTTATDKDGNLVGINDPYKQTKKSLENIEQAIEEAGGKLEDIVRTRMFVTNIDNWDEIGTAHSDAFEGINPVTSMVEINRLIDSEMLIEIEAEAIVTAE